MNFATAKLKNAIVKWSSTLVIARISPWTRWCWCGGGKFSSKGPAPLHSASRSVGKCLVQWPLDPQEPADVRELEHYLTERRKEIDRKYDYRLGERGGRIMPQDAGVAFNRTGYLWTC